MLHRKEEERERDSAGDQKVRVCPTSTPNMTNQKPQFKIKYPTHSEIMNLPSCYVISGTDRYTVVVSKDQFNAIRVYYF